MITEPYMLSAVASVEAIASGSLSSVDLIKSCLSRISETEPEINAWEYLDAESAIAQASKCDEIRKSGKAIGPLHGVPVGLKDIIDTITSSDKKPDLVNTILERKRKEMHDKKK